MDNSLHIGKFISALLKKKKVKKKDFAQAMNYSPTNINALLNRDDWHVKRVLEAEEILHESILVHFIKLPTNEAANLVMEDSPAYIVHKQGDKLRLVEKELAQAKEMIDLLLEQNKYLKKKVKQYEGAGDY